MFQIRTEVKIDVYLDFTPLFRFYDANIFNVIAGSAIQKAGKRCHGLCV